MGCLASAICCAGEKACHCLCKLCKICGTPRKVFARIAYVIFDFVFFVLSLLLMFFGSRFFKVFKWGCVDSLGNSDVACLGVSLVFRMSISLAILHFIMIFIALCKNTCSAAFHDGAWPVKFLIVSALFVASLFIKNTLRIYGILSTSISFLFLSFLAIVLFGLAYKWNDTWVDLHDLSDGGKSRCYIALIIIFTVVFYLGGIGVLVYCYLFYKDTVSIVVISINIAFVVAETVLTLSLKQIEGIKRSTFTCSIVFIISTFYTWSGLLSNPSSRKSLLLSESLIQIIIGTALLLVMLFYISSSTHTASEKTNEKTAIKKIEETVEEEVEEGEKENAKSDEPDPGKDPPTPSLAMILFHVIMFCASIFLAMVLTNWGTPIIKGQTVTQSVVIPQFCFWVRICSEWVANLLFIWTIIAPNVCQSRSFS